MRIFVHLCSFFLLGVNLYAEQLQQPKVQPETYRGANGLLYIHPSTSLGLSIRTGSELEEHTLATGKGGRLFRMKTHGRHSFITKDGRNEIAFPYFVDAKTPTVKIQFLGAVRTKKNQGEVYGKNLRIHFAAKDEDAGIHTVYYRINDGSFDEYEQPIAIEDQGLYRVWVYARDRVGNLSRIVTKEFQVDTSMPVSSLRVSPAVEDDEIQVISNYTKLVLSSEDALAGVQSTRYQVHKAEANRQISKQGAYKTPIVFDRMTEGYYQINYWSADRVGNTESTKAARVFMDTSSPEMKLQFLGDHSRQRGLNYISPRTRLGLIVRDNRAGVAWLKAGLNQDQLRVYNGPMIPPSKDGLFTLKAASQDRVSNKGSVLFKGLFLDKKQPNVSHKVMGSSFSRGSLTFVNPKTQIHLRARDGESGVRGIMVSINDSDPEFFTKSLKFEDQGQYVVSYYGIDRVQNRSPNKTLVLFLDREKPEVFHRFSTAPTGETEWQGRDLKIYPLGTSLFVSATDHDSGLARISYQVDKQRQVILKEAKLTLNKPGFHRYRIIARDQVGNENKIDIHFLVKGQPLLAH